MESKKDFSFWDKECFVSSGMEKTGGLSIYHFWASIGIFMSGFSFFIYFPSEVSTLDFTLSFISNIDVV